MSVGQWDSILAGAYWAGWVLLELDEDEKPVRAFLSHGEPKGREPVGHPSQETFPCRRKCVN
jgi:hypothetical protein